MATKTETGVAGFMTRELNRIKSAIGLSDEPQLADIQAQIKALEPTAARCNEIGATLAKSRGELRNWEIATQDVMRQREAGRRERLHAVGKLTQGLTMAQRAVASIDQLRAENRELLDLPEPDYDNATLTCCGEVIGHCDPSAPRAEVSRQTFEEQSERRREMMQTAWAQDDVAWKTEVEKWQGKHRETPPAKRPPMPERVYRTWADIASRGISND
ncbi:MAG: hypothetical protein HOP29_17230 [Phycisphaerales bacterium]|nr:hypothetical protein [Phycisphaerales bacterium]